MFFIYSINLFLGALLLFSIQPMAAKSLLPIYGGTPAVWIVCMLFFQIMLLLAYGYVWLISLLRKKSVWRFIHIGLIVVSLLVMPLIFHPIIKEGAPEWSILLNLILQIGLPILIVGASAPLLQFAYSQTQGKDAADPYFLYTASNLGSLIALLAYPWLVEQYIGLTFQFQLWSIGYYIYVVLIGFLLLVPRYRSKDFGNSTAVANCYVDTVLESSCTNVYTPVQHSVSPRTSNTAVSFRRSLLTPEIKESMRWPWKDIAYWIYLSFVPCSLMLGVTLYITTDVAATPLFWVIPLALYLLSFILTFTKKPLISQEWLTRNYLFFLIFTILGFILGINQITAWQLIVFNLLSFMILALLCHGQLFLYRPKANLLTLFYFCLAIGGVAAGIFNGILAPHLFHQVYEYPLAILLAVLIVPIPKTKQGWWVPLIVLLLVLLRYFLPEFTSINFGAILALIIIAIWHKNKLSLFFSLLILFAFTFILFNPNSILLQERNFYGVKQVVNKQKVHVLISQSTVHGLQNSEEKKPINGYRAYYGAIEPVVASMQQDIHSLSVIILGLGAGTMACQFRASDQLKIIEIDQQMIDLAKNVELFTYLRDCLPQISIIKNDGRLALAGIADGSQNLLILDAFNSDAIPIHLMTLEAFTLYKQKIAANGGILVNLSNRHLQLLPVINAIGRSLDLMVFSIAHKGDPKLGQFDSEWAFLTANQSLGFQIMKGSHWHFVANDKKFLWTDDYSNIIPLMKWN